MKYFSLAQIQEALKNLKQHHSLFAATFFVLKKAQTPIGGKLAINLDKKNDLFLKECYRAHPKSNYFLSVFRQRGREGKDWLRPDWASKGLQKINTSYADKGIFLHDKNEHNWGFSLNYIYELEKLLPKMQKISLLHAATWFYKYEAFEEKATRKEIVKKFITEFHITKEELEKLFEQNIQSSLDETTAFQPMKVKWQQIVEPYSTPKDIAPEQSGILSYLEIEGIEPVDPLLFEPAQRLNLLTGDNGLGKTLLLDLAWWALTQNWVERQAQPFKINQTKAPQIKFLISSSSGKPLVAKFSNKTLTWERVGRIPAISGLVVYARVDGSFAVWDPINHMLSSKVDSDITPSVVFSREEVWDGKKGQIQGLLKDWVLWQERRNKSSIFDTFSQVLKRLSPPDLGPIEVGEPTRIFGEVRDIPTLSHPYGTVPIVFESAGIKRIITLAYLIVWAWNEHKIQAQLTSQEEERQMVILIDEVEAHLHPKWQRQIIPAILDVTEHLQSDLSLQLIAATHSPLVLASCESIFDDDKDKIFHLDITKSGKVKFNELNFEIRGPIDSWLSSDFFGLKYPGNQQRSEVLEKAVILQQSNTATKKEVEQISIELKRLLADEDPFWIRWVIYAEQFGIEI